MNYSDPRLTASFKDWPNGKHKVPCTFAVETGKRGQRVAKTTTGKPSYSTYADQCAIVTGDDGKVYLLQYHRMYEAVTVMRHDFKNADDGTVFKGSSPETFASLKFLIDAAALPTPEAE